MNIFKKAWLWIQEKKDADMRERILMDAERDFNLVERGGKVFITYGGVRVSEDYDDIEQAAKTTLNLRRLYISECGTDLMQRKSSTTE